MDVTERLLDRSFDAEESVRDAIAEIEQLRERVADLEQDVEGTDREVERLRAERDWAWRMILSAWPGMPPAHTPKGLLRLMGDDGELPQFFPTDSRGFDEG